MEEGDLLKAGYRKGSDELKFEVVKGGFLQMPDGAAEALEGPVNEDDTPEGEA